MNENYLDKSRLHSFMRLHYVANKVDLDLDILSAHVTHRLMNKVDSIGMGKKKKSRRKGVDLVLQSLYLSYSSLAGLSSTSRSRAHAQILGRIRIS